MSPRGYDPVDLKPSLYKNIGVRKFDIVADSPTLPNNYYDLILHSHVMEHIPCTFAFPFYHFSRALKPDGVHVFCVPLMAGCYDEDLVRSRPRMPYADFGQDDHVRRFGKSDIERHLGMVMRLDTNFSLYRMFDAQTLDRHNISESQRTGMHGSTIFIASKSDYRLRSPAGQVPTVAVLVEKGAPPAAQAAQKHQTHAQARQEEGALAPVAYSQSRESRLSHTGLRSLSQRSLVEREPRRNHRGRPEPTIAPVRK